MLGLCHHSDNFGVFQGFCEVQLPHLSTLETHHKKRNYQESGICRISILQKKEFCEIVLRK